MFLVVGIPPFLVFPSLLQVDSGYVMTPNHTQYCRNFMFLFSAYYASTTCTTLSTLNVQKLH